MKISRLILMVVVVAALAVGGIYWLKSPRSGPATDRIEPV